MEPPVANLPSTEMVKNFPISAGTNHYAVIDDRGSVYMAGHNDHGQLGTGNNEYVRESQPVHVLNGVKVISVSCYYNITAFVIENGDVYYSGGKYTALSTPELVEFPIKAMKVAVGNEDSGNEIIGIIGIDHLIYLFDVLDESIIKISISAIDLAMDDDRIAIVTRTGKLYFFGRPFGDQKNDRIKNPTHIPLPELVKQVTIGQDHIAILSITGNVYVWGNDISTVSEDVYLWGWGDILRKPQPEEVSLRQIAASPVKIEHLTTGIRKYIFPSPVSQISCGPYIMAAVTTDHKLFMWGDNFSEEIIDREVYQKSLMYTGESVYQIIHPIQLELGVPVNYISVGYSLNLAVTTDGVVNIWGMEKTNQYPPDKRKRRDIIERLKTIG